MAKLTKAQEKINLYPKGLFEIPVLDRFKYRGRGRPRKTDYSPVGEIQEKLTDLQRNHMELVAHKKWTVK